MSASASLELESALQAHGDQLTTELRLLNEQPQVYLTEKCVFDQGNGRIANKRGVICCLLCCGEQLDQKCNALSGEGACSMQAVDVPLRFTPSRRHGRRAAVLTAPVPKRYKMHKVKDIDSEIRGRCW